MKPEEYLDILAAAARLKTTYRHCATQGQRQESVADHSWRLALMAMLLREEEAFRGLDMDKVVRMCLLHDLGEAFTGDVPAFEKTEADTAEEKARCLRWVASFPSPQGAAWASLLEEMAARETGEAKLYKALDKLEALISHNESDVGTWLSLEHELQLTYGREDTDAFPWLQELRTVVDAWSLRKTEAAKSGGEDPRQRP